MMRSELIRLRAPEPEDIDLLYEWENDPAIWKVSNTLVPFSRFQIEQYVLSTASDPFLSGQVRLMIESEKTGSDVRTIGCIDLYEIDTLNRRAGVGIMIREGFRNQGHASEALALIIAYARDRLLLHQIFCHISDENQASIRLFEKAGFRRSGTRKEWLITKDGWMDEHLYQIILDSNTNRA